MKAIHSIFLTSTAHLSRIVVGFVLLKLIAINLGPEGLGLLGHFMSMVTIVTMLAGGGIINGVIKFVAEYRFQPRKLFTLVSAAGLYSLFFCTVVLVLGCALSKSISILVFGYDELYWVICILAFAQIGFAFTNIVTGVCNGLGDTKTFAIIQIVGSLSALLLAWFLVSRYEIAGAATAVISVFFMGTFPALYYYLTSSFRRKILISSVNSSDFKKLFKFTIMLATSAITFPLVEIVVREFLIRNSGSYEAGLWQASIKLSGAYLGFFSLFLAYYFMPLISPLNERHLILSHVKKIMLFVMMIFIAGASVFYAGRAFFIPLLLSADFSGLESLLAYQLIGDFFKIASYVFGFVGVAKAASKLYVCAEIFQGVLFLGVSLFLGSLFGGAKGVILGYMFTYIIYFSLCAVTFIYWVKK